MEDELRQIPEDASRLKERKISNKALFRKAVDTVRVGRRILSKMESPDSMRKSASLEDLMPEYRPLFEKIMRKQIEMREKLASLRT